MKKTIGIHSFTSKKSDVAPIGSASKKLWLTGFVITCLCVLFACDSATDEPDKEATSALTLEEYKALPTETKVDTFYHRLGFNYDTESTVATKSAKATTEGELLAKYVDGTDCNLTKTEIKTGVSANRDTVYVKQARVYPDGDVTDTLNLKFFKSPENPAHLVVEEWEGKFLVGTNKYEMAEDYLTDGIKRVCNGEIWKLIPREKDILATLLSGETRTAIITRLPASAD